MDELKQKIKDRLKAMNRDIIDKQKMLNNIGFSTISRRGSIIEINKLISTYNEVRSYVIDDARFAKLPMSYDEII